MSELARLGQELSGLKTLVESFSTDVRQDIKNLQKLITVSAISEVEITHIKDDLKQVKQQVNAYGKRLYTLEQTSLLSKAKSKSNEWFIRFVIGSAIATAFSLIKGFI